MRCVYASCIRSITMLHTQCSVGYMRNRLLRCSKMIKHFSFVRFHLFLLSPYDTVKAHIQNNTNCQIKRGVFSFALLLPLPSVLSAAFGISRLCFRYPSWYLLSFCLVFSKRMQRLWKLMLVFCCAATETSTHTAVQACTIPFVLCVRFCRYQCDWLFYFSL